MKKVILLLMCAVLVLALASCSLLESAATPGKDGVDGITPDFKVDGGELFVSYDGGETWTTLGNIQGADGKDGVDGAPGEKGDKGDPGEDGKDGAPGEKGEDGIDGAPGANGTDGITPSFKVENGELFVSYDDGENWTSLGYIQGADGAPGEKGDKGDPGEDGKDGVDGTDGKDGADAKDPTIEISEDGYWVINGVKTEYKATEDAIPVCQHRDADDNYYCDKCEKPYVDGTDVPILPEHNHRFGEWKYYSESHEYCENALYFRTCSGCNVIEWKDGSEDDHNYVVVVTPSTCYSIGYSTKTCSSCGKSEVYNETAVAPHTYTTYSVNNTYHWKQCQFCDMRIEYTEHTLDDQGICSVCDSLIADTDGLIYDVSLDGTYAEVVGYVGTSKRVRIASEYKGLPVTNIYKSAFSGKSITSVIIPDSVTTIGSSAFDCCYSLTSVTIPDSVTTIGSSAFYYCSSLTSVTIPDSVTTIGGSAFSNCRSLTSVIIPDSVTTIGFSVFSGCNSALYTEYEYGIYVGDASNPYKMLVGLVSKNLSTYTIHEDTRYIQGSVFESCSRLVSIDIPDSVTTIGDYAFQLCSSLTSVTIPDSVTTIGKYAFANCSSLTSVIFEDPTGWWYADSADATSGTAISESSLANASTAAYYLRSSYRDKYWFKD